MKAIIIEEDRFAELVVILQGVATSFATAQRIDQFVAMHMGKVITPENARFLVDDIHRAYHYQFVKWAQSHGASCVR